MVAETAETEPDEAVTLHQGDCLEVLRTLPDESVHAVVTDPPYGLSSTTPEQVARCLKEWASGDTTFAPAKRGGFMGKDWDSFVPPPAVWEECYRVLKPGGHLLAFAGSRTQDLMGMSVRLAGFDIRDNFAWLYGSGFPKSMDVSKAIDKAAGAERDRVPNPLAEKQAASIGTTDYGDYQAVSEIAPHPATPEAQQWEGWGTALKPAFEPVIMARKPFKGTVAANVLEHGTGAINIDASRIAVSSDDDIHAKNPHTKGGFGHGGASVYGASGGASAYDPPAGRFPANVLLDESQAAALDEQSGESKSPPVGSRTKTKPRKSGSMAGGFEHDPEGMENGYGDSGGASRFFYCAKAPKSERPKVDGVAHPTVKPLALMRYLVRMVTPPGGVVLDPFAGTGTTLQAARDEGFHAIGIEAQAEYIPLAKQRLG